MGINKELDDKLPNSAANLAMVVYLLFSKAVRIVSSFQMFGNANVAESGQTMPLFVFLFFVFAVLLFFVLFPPFSKTMSMRITKEFWHGPF